MTVGKEIMQSMATGTMFLILHENTSYLKSCACPSLRQKFNGVWVVVSLYSWPWLGVF